MPDLVQVERLAHRIRRATDVGDLALLATVLDDDVRMGGEEDTDDTCHCRAEILAWYGRMRGQGVHARVFEVVVRPDAAVLGMNVFWPPGLDERPATFFQVFRIVDGRVKDIRAYVDRDDALAFAG